MGSIVLDMSMSLDGFIAGPDDDEGQGLGVDGHRLHADHIELEITRVVDAPGVTHLHYRVNRTL